MPRSTNYVTDEELWEVPALTFTFIATILLPKWTSRLVPSHCDVHTFLKVWRNLAFGVVRQPEPNQRILSF